MFKSQIERRLIDNGDRLKRLRSDLQVANEQLEQLDHEADDARLRALVSETPLADKEHREAARHAAAMHKHRKSVIKEIERLEQIQDELLDELSAS